MRLCFSYSNSAMIEIDEDEVLFIRNYPVSITSKPGYERTKDEPPEWSKFTALRAGFLAVGHDVNTGGQVLQVTGISNTSEQKEQ